MTRPSVERPDRLLRDLTSKYREHLADYRQWLTIANSASERLALEEFDEFLQLHEQKHVVTERLRAQERQLRSERDELSARLGLEEFTLAELGTVSPGLADGRSFAEAVDDWRQLLTQLNVVMQQVAKVERQTEDKLRQRLGSLTEAMSDARSTRRAVRAYNRPDADGHDGRFIDRRG